MINYQVHNLTKRDDIVNYKFYVCSMYCIIVIVSCVFRKACLWRCMCMGAIRIIISSKPLVKRLKTCKYCDLLLSNIEHDVI